MPKQGLCLKSKPSDRQAALYLLYIGAQSQPYLQFLPLVSLPAFMDLCHFPFIPSISGFPTRIISGSQSLRTSVHWADPRKEGRRTHVVLGRHTGTSALLKQPRMPLPGQQASSIVCLTGDCLTHPSRKYTTVIVSNFFSTFLVSFSSCIFLSPSSVPYASRTCLDYFPTKVTDRCKPLHTYSANGFQSGGFRCTLTSLELTRRSRYM